MDKYRNKYRTTSHRMSQWDYSDNRHYFITLVTQNRECNLGCIINTSNSNRCNNAQPCMVLSDFGKIIETEWLKSFEIRNELFLDEFIIMPNHLHAIVILDKPVVKTHGRASLPSTPQPSTPQSSSQSSQPIIQTPFIRKPKSISSFVAGFKSAVNSKIDDYIDEHNMNIQKFNKNNQFFQPDYYDHIIRNDFEYQRIKDYIINNPLKWDNDKFNPLNENIEK